MSGVILCKNNGDIHVIAHGDYEELQRNLSFYCKIAGSNELKLVNTTGLNIESILKNQTDLNATFYREFN